MSPTDFPLLTLVLIETFAVANVQSSSHFRVRLDRLSSGCPTRCNCESDTVDCSWLEQRDIPTGISVETHFLHLEHNFIESLVHMTRLRNLSRLQFLDLSNNFISTLGDSDFIDLANLRILNLSSNRIHMTNSNAFIGLWGLWFLDLSFNPLSELQKGFLYPLMNLTELDLTSTGILFKPEDYLNLTNLRKFVFEWNDLHTFPQFLYNGCSLFPKLVELTLNENSFRSINSSGLDSLEILSVGSNMIRWLLADALTNLTRLRSMNLSGNIPIFIENASLCSDTLRQLDLSNSAFYLADWTSEVFNCIPNLEELFLGGVQVYEVHQPFRYLKRLKRLDLEKSDMNDAEATRLLSGLKRLEWLSLHENSISTLFPEMFEDFASTLKVLILSSNRITTLDITSLPVQFWTSLDRIDLSDNPFICDCQLTWFLRWLSSANVSTNVSVTKWRNYQCSAPATQINKLLRNLKHLTEKECFEELMNWCPILVFLLAMLFSASSTIGSILYRIRWHLKYWYFKHKIQRRQNAVSSDDRYYEYDAFVSYCEHDTHWVVTELRHHLETEEEGIRLCIHDRDFQVGEDIVSNIISCIEQSRKVLLVVSNAFAASQWCHFELARVQTRMLENDRDNLVLILLEELNDVDVPPRLKLQMEKKTNLEWTSSRIGRQLFWERLRQELGRPPESVVNSPLPIELFRSGSH